MGRRGCWLCCCAGRIRLVLRLWLGAQRLDGGVGVAAAQLGVGRHGAVPGRAGRLLPGVVSGLGLGQPTGHVLGHLLPPGVHSGPLCQPLPRFIGVGGLGVASGPVRVDLGAADLPADHGQLSALVRGAHCISRANAERHAHS